MKGTTMVALSVLAASAVHAETQNFDQQKTGAAPDGCSCGVTGRGKPVWTVDADRSAPSAPNVLRQSGSGTFPWCVNKAVSLADGFVVVKFKPEKGREDQAGGAVWRWKDPSATRTAGRSSRTTSCLCGTDSRSARWRGSSTPSAVSGLTSKS